MRIGIGSLVMTALIHCVCSQKPRNEAPEFCGPPFGSLMDCINLLEKDALDIDLSNRGIDFIPDGAFTKFVNLKTLDLSHNHIQYLSPGVFTGLAELAILKLNNNKLQGLLGPPEAWTFLSNIGAVNLGMNPFNCNCSIGWFRNLLAREEMVLDVIDVKCAEPLAWNGLALRDIPTHYDLVCKGSNFAQEICGTPLKFPCTTTEPTNVCILKSKLCDGTNDCVNGMDESPYVCNGRLPPEPTGDANLFKNPPLVNLFNGMVSRNFGLPILPTTMFPIHGSSLSGISKPCRVGSFKCYSNICISQKSTCDGKLDCPDGADEDVSLCIGRQTPKPTTTLPSTSTASTRSIPQVTATILPRMITSTSGVSSSPNIYFGIDTPSPIPDFLTNLLAKLNFSVPFRNLQGTSTTRRTTTTTQWTTPTEAPTNPTITFPNFGGEAHYVNHPMGGEVADVTSSDPSVQDDTSASSDDPSVGTSASTVDDTIPQNVLDQDRYQPQKVRILNLKNNEISVLWDAPISARAGSWRLVAYSVVCDIIRVSPPTKKKKFSPLLSTLVHDYQFHHILPDDSLTITVKALYEDSDHQRYESVSDPYLRSGSYEITKPPAFVRKESVAAAQNVNYPGKMGFEDLIGISTGGTLVGLMVVILAIYFIKKRRSQRNVVTLRKMHKRTLRMKKLDRTIQRPTERAMEPIYSEVDYAHNLTAAASLSSSQPHAGNTNADLALKVQTLDVPIKLEHPQYIQVLESDSQYYYASSSQPTGCSEYSCFSVSGQQSSFPYSDPTVIGSHLSSIGESAYTLYDSDNCSVGYYVANNGFIPRCSHTASHGVVVSNGKRFGDTIRIVPGDQRKLTPRQGQQMPLPCTNSSGAASEPGDN